jgi:beta-glucanase (GH16 family)
MSDVLSRHHRPFLAVAALTASLVGCGQSTPAGSLSDANAVGAGGATTGTGGTTVATGGNGSGGNGSGGNGAGEGGTSSTGGNGAGEGGASSTGGATTGTGGTAGGASTGTGGRTAGAGGSTAGTGGRTAGTGGSTAGTGGGSGAAGDGGTVRSDGAGDAPLARDGAPDGAAPPGDARPESSGADGDGGIPVPSGYKLVWSDEFDVDGAPNAKNWNYEKGFVRNNELQWYQANNATVQGGLLVIEGRQERVTNPNYQAGSSDWKTSRQYADYTSTSMTTSGLQSWQYGRFEMRGKIPTATGMWPAWWALGVSGEWPSNGEIDMMEYYKGNVLANVACGTSTRWQAKWDSSTKAISSLGANWSSSFHVWRMDWDDQKIDLYLDDTLMNSVALSSMLNADGSSPFKQKAYMILNLAIGGDNGGDPSATTFPQQYLVDYVRVYQKL